MRFLLSILTCFALNISSALATLPVPKQIGMPVPATPVKENIIDFHNLLVWIMGGVFVFVTLLLVFVMWRFRASKNPKPATFTHNVKLEAIWTAIPVLILFVIAVPSFRLMYFMDHAADADMTIKVTGYQWYWGYEYPDHGDINFLSYMIPDNELKAGQPRLLATDNEVIVPAGKAVRVLVTAADVIHSWAVPAFGVKKDAVPGRLNETWFQVDKPGVYYGQCSEICGIGHGFMPITVRVVPEQDFNRWVVDQGGQLPSQKES